jgi:serine/threonine-protein kinase RsbW
MRSDLITLTVPARGEYAKTVRLTAAELASRLGMSYDEVDDVRMAAEEAFVYACSCLGDDDDVTFTFDVAPGSLSVAVGPLPGTCAPAGRPREESYAEFILRSVCDEFAIEAGEDSCTLRLNRRVAALPEDAGA